MLGVWDYTVILTYLSALLSLSGMGLALSGKFGLSMLFLALSGICDLFDGQVARSKRNRTADEKKFGIQIDSLCDLVSFGVFPAVAGFSLNPTLSPEKLVFVLFPLCGLIRLAFYNVQEENRQKETEEKRKYFTGVPITSSAVLFPFLYLFSNVIPGDAYYIIYVIFSGILMCLFVLKLRFPKPAKPLLFALITGGIFLLIRGVLFVVL